MKLKRQLSGGPDRYSRRRAAVLALVYALMVLHILHWKLAGRTLAPLELNEVMYTLELGIVTTGFIFMALAVLATAIFGRFFCSWGCHILALEDLSAWLLNKMRIRPKPVRSRALFCVPILAMLYMFVWPQASRLAAGEQMMPALHVRADAQGWASFVTTNFWRNLPGPGITALTFAICGFFIVYFLGSRGFCTYACPYGAIFSLADRIAPGRIVAKKDDCSRCGICTATCQSRVRVHEEVLAFGRVVNPACLKDLDCIAVCPDGALGYGSALPALLERDKNSRLPRKPYDFSFVEDALIAATCLASLFIFRGLYYSVPFLLTLAIGGILGYVFVLAVRLLRHSHVKLNNFQLKIGGGLTRTGRVFIASVATIGLLMVHSGLIRYHQFRGDRLFQAIEHAHGGVSDAVHQDAIAALRHLDFCDRWGLIWPAELAHRRAALHGGVGQRFADCGNFGDALRHLEIASRADPNDAAIHYNLGVVLSQTGKWGEALGHYRSAATLNPHDPEIHNNLGHLLAQRGEFHASVWHLHRAIELKPDFAHPHFNLGRVLEARGNTTEAQKHFELAARLDPLYREVLSSMLSESTIVPQQIPANCKQGVSP